MRTSLLGSRRGLPLRRIAIASALAAVLVSTAATVPASAATEGRVDVGTTRPARNHAPDQPTGLRIGGPTLRQETCAPLPGVAVTGQTRPHLWATVTDPDVEGVSARFVLGDARTGRVLWAPAATTAQLSGATHAVQVPEGLLVDGGSYWWLALGIDVRGKVGLPAACLFSVDTTKPAPPTIEAVEGSAPAVYREDQVAGGVGIAGEFRVTAAPGDAVGVQYSFGSPAFGDVVPLAADGTVSFTYVPRYAGPDALYARTIDAAGNVSTEVRYDFYVASTGPGSLWLLDEGDGLTAADGGEQGDVNPLTLTDTVTWGPGLYAEFGEYPGDLGLLFDEPGDGAQTAGPVVATSGDFSVVAYVRADQATAAATAVSQDGDDGSGFTLGMRTGVDCPDGVGPCWAFSMPGTGASPAAVATSTVPATSGSWVMLAGVRSAAQGTVSLHVCEYGTPSEPADTYPVMGDPVALGPTGVASGPLRLSGTAEPWYGAIGAVRTYRGALDETDVLVACFPGY